ncbi:MAG: hypothetical protein AAF518_16040, partial [Spirochaetota bacterium]
RSFILKTFSFLRRHKFVSAFLIFFILAIPAFYFYIQSFASYEREVAFSLITGIGVRKVQKEVDRLEDKAIHKKKFSKSEKLFLKAIYSVLYKCGQHSYIFRQTGYLMERYLQASGKDFVLKKRIFVNNKNVIEQIDKLKKKLVSDARNKSLQKEYRSKTFYMPHRSSLDSIYGLYYGFVKGKVLKFSKASVTIKWRAEVPWHWPSYDSLYRKYGKYHVETVPIPSLTIFLGNYLLLDNGLGEYLVPLGIAVPFSAYSEWQERIDLSKSY